MNLLFRWVVDRQLEVVVAAKRTPWVIHSNKPPALALLAPVRPTMDDARLDNIRAPVVKVDAGVPVGKEPVVRRRIPRTEKSQSSLKSSGRTSKPKQRRRRRESVRGRGT